MIILDTDHLSILEYPERPQYQRLVSAMDKSADRDFTITAVSLEEQLRAWLAAIHRTKKVRDQILYYARLTKLIDLVVGRCCRSMSVRLTGSHRFETKASALGRWI